MNSFVILGVSGLFCCFCSIFLCKILLANSEDPDQMPHYMASDLGLHYFSTTLLWVCGKEWVNCSVQLGTQCDCTSNIGNFKVPEL